MAGAGHAPLTEGEAALKYVILIYGNPASRAAWESFSAAQRAEGLEVYEALNRDLTASGELIVTEALADPSQAWRVGTGERGAIATDGPFAEAKEHLAGFYLVDCASLDRALEIAARVPEADLGLVEVRPVAALDDLAG